MASKTENVKLGVCGAFFGAQDLGLTIGGVEVAVSTETKKVEVDQYGKTPINEIIMGRQVSVKVPMAETTLRNMLATMPGSSLVTDGAQASGTLTFAANPTSSTTFTIGGQAFTFQAGKPTTPYQVQLGATRDESLLNAVAVINRAVAVAPAAGGVNASADLATGVITIKANDPGTAGNAVTLVAASGATASGANLSGGVAETKARIEVTDGAGIDLLATAKELRLHPKGKAATDFSEDFVVFKAATAGALQFAYKVDSERVFNVEFMGYPDTTRGGKLYAVGDLLA